jgi:hypothetical protein
MSNQETDTSNSVVSMILNPSRGLANWYVCIGMLGIFLAILNILGYVHPTYHLSWGGLLLFEAFNAAFEIKSDSPQFVASDAVFIGFCSLLLSRGFQTISNDEDGIGGWFTSLFVNDTWPALVDPDLGGWNKLVSAWCLLLGFVFYMYYGILHTGWIDIGVYSVSVALLAFGFALKLASEAPEGEDNLD